MPLRGGLRGLAQVVFRHRMKAGGALAAVLAAAVLAMFVLPPVWRAEGSLSLAAAELADPARALAAETESLARRELHERVVAGIGPQALYPGRSFGDATTAFGRHLAVTPLRDAGALDLAFRHADREMAAHALERLMREHLADRRGDDEAGEDRLAVAAGARLAAAQARLAAFRQQHGVFAFDEQRQLLLRERSALDAERKAAAREADEGAERLRALAAQAAATPPTVALEADPARLRLIDETRGKLLELQLKEQQLLAKYTDTSQFVRPVREEIRRVEAFLRDISGAAGQRSVANPLLQDLERETLRQRAALRAVEARRDGLAAQLAATERQLRDLAGQEIAVRDLEREVEVAEAAYRAERRRAQELRSSGRAAPELVALRTPTVPARPLWPDPPLVLGVAFAGGIGLALLVVALAEALSPGMATPRAVERRLGLPVLASIGDGD